MNLLRQIHTTYVAEPQQAAEWRAASQTQVGGRKLDCATQPHGVTLAGSGAGDSDPARGGVPAPEAGTAPVGSQTIAGRALHVSGVAAASGAPACCGPAAGTALVAVPRCCAMPNDVAAIPSCCARLNRPVAEWSCYPRLGRATILAGHPATMRVLGPPPPHPPTRDSHTPHHYRNTRTTSIWS